MAEEKRMINVFSNGDSVSREMRRVLKQKLEKSGFAVPRVYSSEVELVICVGGDGSFLKTLHKYDFPETPFVGVNTGHLGFFQELHPDQLDEFIFKYKQGQFETQKLRVAKAVVYAGEREQVLLGLNEVVIKDDRSQSIHLNLFIGDSFIERFSGDGILISTPAGSTAYNYALGGSIVDPRLSVLQVTPIAPMNTTAYRSFTSSIILPSDLSVSVYPEYSCEKGVIIVTDGSEHRYSRVEKVTVEFAPNIVSLLRLDNYDFWSKVKSKFL